MTLRADQLTLHSGSTVEGTIIEETEDAVKMETGLGIAVTYYKDEIAGINRSEKEEAVQDDPSGKTAQEYYEKGLSYMQHEKFKWAAEQFVMAIKADSEHIPAHHALSQARAAQGDFEGAWDDLEAVLNIDGNDAEAWLGLGLLAGKKGDLDEAAAKLKKARDLYQKENDLEKIETVREHLNRIKIFLEYQGDQDALDQFNRSIGEVFR